MMSEDDMTPTASIIANTEEEPRYSWQPMVAIGLGQALLSLNFDSLLVSIGGIVASFDTSPTTVGTAIVTYSLAVAGFIMLGAKLGQIFGSLNVFRASIAIFAVAMAIMTFSPNAASMIAAQGIAGLAASTLIPALVVLIANNYKGRQQAQALGLLGGVGAMAGVLAFFIAGTLGTLIGWRYAFALLIPVTLLTLFMSRHLRAVPAVPHVRIDVLGVGLAATAIILISLGSNNLTLWGLLTADPDAPLDLFGLSPAPVMIVIGIVLWQSFIAWSYRRMAAQQMPLAALTVIESPQERSAMYAVLAVAALGSAVSFLTPLYIQMVQGNSSLQTAVALTPYQAAVSAAAILTVRLYNRLTPRQIARCAFVVMAMGLAALAIVIRNEWSNFLVKVCLILIGIGKGSLATLLFNVLVSASPKALAGDVGALRGTASNLAAGVGTALVGALAVGILSANIQRGVADNLTIPHELIEQVDLDNATFVSNDRLLDVMARTTATPEQVTEAVRINAEARLRALKTSLFVLAGIALLMIYPVGRLPSYVRGEVPSGPKNSDLVNGSARKTATEGDANDGGSSQGTRRTLTIITSAAKDTPTQGLCLKLSKLE
jgi:predicted MFS family arabinose efflux permease